MVEIWDGRNEVMWDAWKRMGWVENGEGSDGVHVEFSCRRWLTQMDLDFSDFLS